MKCSGKIYGDYRDVSGRVYPCSRNATVERDGKWYCWQHDPERVKTDKKRRRAKWEVDQQQKNAQYARRAAVYRACEGIPTEKLSAGLVQEMLEVLKTLLPFVREEWSNSVEDANEYYEVAGRARALIAKTEADE